MKHVIFSLALLAWCDAAIAERKLNQVLIYSSKAPQIYRDLEKKNFDVGHGILNRSTVQVFTYYPKRVLSSIHHKIDAYKVIKSQSYLKTVADNEEPYFNADQTLQFMNDLKKKFPQAVQLFDLNKTFKIKKTVDGNSIWALRVGAGQKPSNEKPKILIIGQHHARELMTHHAVVDSAQDYLQQIKKGNKNARAAFKNVDVWFVPVVNPDGLNYVFTGDRMWRKNRRPNSDGSFGVDLNRNYTFGWGKCGSHSSNPPSQVYKGIAPLSEIEAQVMNRLNAELKAQFIASYHSSGDEVLHPYICGDLGGEEKIYNDIRDRLAKVLGFRKRLPSSSGEDFEHHFNWHGTVSFLIELGRSFQPPFSVYRNTVWPNVKKVVPFFLKELRQSFVSARLLDKTTKKPLLGVQMEIVELPLMEKERRETSRSGLIRRRAFPGEYTVKFSYQGRQKTLKMKAGQDVKEILI